MKNTRFAMFRSNIAIKNVKTSLYSNVQGKIQFL